MDFSKYKPRVFSFEYNNDILWDYRGYDKTFCSQHMWNNTIVTKINYCRNIISKLTNGKPISSLVISNSLHELIQSNKCFDGQLHMLMNYHVMFSCNIEKNTIEVFNSEYKMRVKVINYEQDNI